MELNELRIRRNRELLLAALSRQGLLDVKPEPLSGLLVGPYGRTALGDGALYYPKSLFPAGRLRFPLAGTGGPHAPDAPLP